MNLEGETTGISEETVNDIQDMVEGISLGD